MVMIVKTIKRLVFLKIIINILLKYRKILTNSFMMQGVFIVEGGLGGPTRKPEKRVFGQQQKESTNIIIDFHFF